MGRPTVAVIGCGPFGLATLKNLLEEDFDATAFDKRHSIGGVWEFNENVNYTSTLPTTVSNVSKYKSCFTDFPVPDDMPVFLSASQVSDYLKSYAQNFDLYRHIRFNTEVRKVERDADNTKWQLYLSGEKGEEVIDYDKVVFCSGLTALSRVPNIEGIQQFAGKVIHSQAFKHPSDFAGMKVLVVGLGNSAVDTCTELVGFAEKVYVSHRHGMNIFPRYCKGKPLDFHIRRRDEAIKHALAAIAPGLSKKLHDMYVQRLTKESFNLDPAWRIHPPPSILTHQPTISDSFVDCLQDGSISSVVGIRRFRNGNGVELVDGSVIAVDAVIFGTGYLPDFGIFAGQDLTSDPKTSEHGDLGYDWGYRLPFPRLYQNIFPPEYSDSIAFLNNWAFAVGTFPIADLASMAIAQVWRGTFALPSREDMDREIDVNHLWLRSLAKEESVYPAIVPEGPWLHWLHKAAGTGVNENLGYGLQGWLFWFRNPRFCNLLMGGVASVHTFRLFDGRRKKWQGAKDAILRANDNAKLYIEKH
ncbi:flavin monooxygenase-like protein [Lipomyces tetrasporus]|uniref:Flavin monooxygenase-like protein n=1 Tax=Lipomyces tetrasporus TaxID=54092 RepID=A0AAD7R1X4_9ASCO|nr:flavin monooxygenase-like protein [Lipomyces tetrasporus]KAJ8104402.1 flavin monooxygenase-like protein [Lipomyces tetrasporus]